ncbi:MAG: DNA primase, partial [Actinomycetes bacterium]
VRELVARRVPLFQFAIRSAIADHDLDTAEGRVAALRASAPLLAKIKDRALRPEYARLVAGWIGIDQSAVTDEVRRLSRSDTKASTTQRPAPRNDAEQDVDRSQAPTGWERPDPRNTAFSVEREAIKCALQIPLHVDSWYAIVEPTAYTAPLHVVVHEAITAAGLPGSVSDGHAWVEAVLLHCPDDQVRAYVRELVVDPLHTNDDSDEDLRVYGSAVVARLLEMDATRRTVELKHRLQRTSPTDEPEIYNRMFADLLGLEQVRRQLREQALGGLEADEPRR